METVTLKSRVGPYGPITRTVQLKNSEGIVERYERVKYYWPLENDCRCVMPRQVWEELEHEYLDRQQRLQYKDAFLEL